MQYDLGTELDEFKGAVRLDHSYRGKHKLSDRDVEKLLSVG
jgi:hypothetical protein